MQWKIEDGELPSTVILSLVVDGTLSLDRVLKYKYAECLAVTAFQEDMHVMQLLH